MDRLKIDKKIVSYAVNQTAGQADEDPKTEYRREPVDGGAEVIRMLHTLVGAKGFRDGMDLYFKRHDGQAVTCDDFVNFSDVLKIFFV